MSNKTTWVVEIVKTQICVVEIQAEDYSDVQFQARNLAKSIDSCSPVAVRYESAHRILGNVGGRLHAAMYDLHPPSDVLLVKCPGGAVFRPKAAERILEIAQGCGIEVVSHWNGNAGIDGMSIQVAKRPSDTMIAAFNEALCSAKIDAFREELPVDLFVFDRVDRALKSASKDEA